MSTDGPRPPRRPRSRRRVIETVGRARGRARPEGRCCAGTRPASAHRVGRARCSAGRSGICCSRGARRRRARSSIGSSRATSRTSHENHWVTKRGERRLVAWSNTGAPRRPRRVSAIVATGLDITERTRAEEALRRQASRLEALAEASRVFASGLDYKTTLDTVARRLAELIGDGALIRVVSPDGAWLVPVAVYHPSPERARCAGASSRRAAADDGGDHRARPLDGARRCASRTSRSSSSTDEMKPEYWPYLEGVTSLMIAPLEHRRQVFGHITLMRDAGGRRTPPRTRRSSRTSPTARRRRSRTRGSTARRRRRSPRATSSSRSPRTSCARRSPRSPRAREHAPRLDARRSSGSRRDTSSASSRPPSARAQRLEKLVAALLDVSRIHMGRLELDVEEVELGAVVARRGGAPRTRRAQTGSTIDVRGRPCAATGTGCASRRS